MDLTRNRIPRKITPDRLTNAVVTVRLQDKFSSSYLEGKLVDAYNKRHPDLVLDKLKANSKKDNPTVYFFANKLFRVIFRGNVVAFNFVDKYRGWDTYASWIRDVLNDDDVVIKGVGLHYVSEYRNVEIFSQEVIDGNISFNHIQNFAGTELQYKCYVHDFDDHQIIIGDATVKLTNAALIQGMDGTLSRIDINIDSTPYNGTKEQFYVLMEKLHRHELTLFYSMLSENFVQSLNPEYD